KGQIKSLVAINDLGDAVSLAHLLTYDSNYGHIGVEVSGENFTSLADPDGPSGILTVDGHDIHVFAQKDPVKLPWADLKIDVVIESTGKFTDAAGAGLHLTAGAKRVVISAPAKDPEIKTLVMGINQLEIRQKDLIISNASCTTNCIAPVAAIIAEHFGIRKAMMTTIHSYTADQNLQDGPHKDLRRARAAAVNIVPTSTGATLAAAEVVVELKELFAGLAIRVPVAVGSLSDFTFVLKKKTTVEAVNQVLTKASQHKNWRGILSVTQAPIVSSDIIGDTHSAIIDLSLTALVDGDLLKVVAWYDNEFGYSNRLIEAATLISHLYVKIKFREW
ncbi:MAG: gap, partial [Candidatus Berkelbacteria bacterium Gr01-1014_85]